MNPFADIHANFDQNRLNQMQQARTAPMPQTVVPHPSRHNFLTDSLPTVGGIIGGLGGGALGALAGGVGAVPGAGLGGAAGSGIGQALENALTGDNLGKNVAKEAILGGIFSAGPIKLAKLGLGIPAALAARGGEEAAGMGAKALVEGGAKKVAGDVASQGGEQALKTSFAGRMTTSGNKALASQYGTITRAVSKETRPLETIGKLADYGIVKPTDAERISHAITGSNGVLTQQVAKAIGDAGTVPLGTIPSVLEKSITDAGIAGSTRAAGLEKMVGSQLKMIEAQGGKPEAVMTAIRNLEDHQAQIMGKFGTNHNATSEDGLVSKAISGVTKELQDQLYNAAGANKNIANVLTPEVRDQLLQLHPKSNEWAKFVNGKIMNSKTVGELRNAQAPFVKMSKLIEDADLNNMTYGGRVGNAANSFSGKVLDAGLNLAKDPAARFSGKAMRDIGSGEIANQSAKGLGGIATNLGTLSMLDGGLNGGTRATPDASTGAGQSFGPNMDTQSTSMNPNMPNATSPMSNGNMAGQYQNNSQQSSPYSKEALMFDINRDPQNAAKYIDYYSKLSDIFTPADNSQKLNSTQTQQQNTAISGIQSLQDIAGFLEQNPNAPKADLLPGFTRGITGVGSFHTAVQNAADAIGRLRSGGAINSQEESTFRNFLPSAFDDPATTKYKLSRLNAIFQRFADPQPASNDLTGALMQQQGAFQ